MDDTDGLDLTAEFEAWRLRELGRIKRDKEEQMKREEEKEEVERRRALPEAQRMKEDLEHAKKLREEKPKGQQKFLQKYWHKGAFHQVRHLDIPIRTTGFLNSYYNDRMMKFSRSTTTQKQPNLQ